MTAICRPTSSASKRLRGRSSRTLFERSPVASLVIDEAALILDANRAARSAIDAGAEQLYGTPLCELFAREHHREVERAVRMAADTNARASERAFEVQLANRHRGDTRAPAASFVFAVETLGKGELLVALADISTLKQAESVLTHSRDRLHQLAEPRQPYRHCQPTRLRCCARSQR